MNDTPETDEALSTAECESDLVLRMRRMERERDAARKDAEKTKAYKKVLKTTNANLKRERDEAVNNYESAQLLAIRVGEHRDMLMFSIKEIYNISSFDYDTMPEAARRSYHGIVLEIADKARKHLTSNTI
jgi:hypothetical protein